MIQIAKPQIGDEEKHAVLEVLNSGQLAQGPKVREFEESFAKFCGSKYAVATSSGTSALHVALLAHGIGEGDEVITSPFSFVASANCALYVGASPVFAEIEARFFTLDPASLAEKITTRTKAIIPIHLYGQPCDMEAIAAIATERGLEIIEDACQAHGAMLNGKPVGSWGTACYSFYPTKNMTTVEGGMITTNDAAIAEKARMFRDHGSPRRYEHILLGYNFRMTDIQAAIGLAQLTRLEQWNHKRIFNAGYLTEKLSRLGNVQTPAVRKGAVHVFHQYTVQVRERDYWIDQLKTRGIGYGIHYPTPIYRQPLYQKLGYKDYLPVTELACEEVLSLPVHAALSLDDLDCIVEAFAS